MSVVKCISWNVRGLNSKFKRALLFNFLKAHNPHLLCLQEMHLLGSKVMALKKCWVMYGYHSTYSSYARGVSVLVRKGLPFSCERVVLDPKGRYVFLQCTVHATPLLLVVVYAPPLSRRTFSRI